MKRLAIEIGICAVFAIISAVAVRCSSERVKQAESEASQAAQDALDAEHMLREAEKEKRELEAILNAYDRAFVFAEEKTKDAIKDFTKREEKISEAEHDNPEWCADELPSSVRDAFADYVCKDSTTDGPD